MAQLSEVLCHSAGDPHISQCFLPVHHEPTMRLFYLFRTINTTNGKINWSVHASSELLMADEHINDAKYWPFSKAVRHDHSLGHVIHNYPVQAFATRLEAEAAWRRNIDSTPEHLRYNLQDTRGPKTGELLAKMTRANRSYTWITDGKRSLKVLREGLVVPEGWRIGCHWLTGGGHNRSHLDPVKVKATLAANKAKAKQISGGQGS